MVLNEDRLSKILPKENDPLIKDEVKAQKLRWAMLVLTWIGWILSVASVADCTLFVLVPDPKELEITQLRGLFTVGYYEQGILRGCIAYPSDANFKSAFKASRVFGVFLTVLMSFSLLLVTAMMFFVTRHHVRRLFLWHMRIINPLAFCCSIFLFSVFGSDECKAPGASCSPAAAGIIAAINVLVLLVVSILAVLVPGPKSSLFIPIWQVQEKVVVEEAPKSTLPTEKRKKSPKETAIIPRTVSPPPSPTSSTSSSTDGSMVVKRELYDAVQFT